MSATRIALIGMGRMGRTLEQLAPERGCEVVARIDADVGAAGISGESLNGAQAAIEFTQPDAAVENIRACIAAGCPIVVGTTGWYEQRSQVETEVRARGGAILAAPNFSIGVAIFDRIAAEAGRLFATAAAFDAHLVETHHTAKKDAPSGTAASLAHSASATLGRDIPITSVRVGSVPGTHELVFDAPFEQVRLVHEARDRRVFAEGALAAARWIAGRTGVFTLQDLLTTPSA